MCPFADSGVTRSVRGTPATAICRLVSATTASCPAVSASALVCIHHASSSSSSSPEQRRRAFFLPRDAMLAPYMCCGAVSVRLSVTCRYCIETAERIKLIFGIRLTSAYPSYTALESEFGFLQSKIGVFPRTLSQTLHLADLSAVFRHGTYVGCRKRCRTELTSSTFASSPN